MIRSLYPSFSKQSLSYGDRKLKAFVLAENDNYHKAQSSTVHHWVSRTAIWSKNTWRHVIRQNLAIEVNTLMSQFHSKVWILFRISHSEYISPLVALWWLDCMYLSEECWSKIKRKFAGKIFSSSMCFSVIWSLRNTWRNGWWIIITLPFYLLHKFLVYLCWSAIQTKTSSQRIYYFVPIVHITVMYLDKNEQSWAISSTSQMLPSSMPTQVLKCIHNRENINSWIQHLEEIFPHTL